MSEFLENVSEEVLGQDGETPERGRPGTDPAQEPQPGLHPGAGRGPDQAGDGSEQDQPSQEQDQPEQGLGEPDSH
ncbi:hypothetical protein [Jatrophihabitans sp.]|jgi:hypothetical protein|uniref:hypothetical protein n=1 Tax=Jatrophihabitans sp. TaxID=1932789 RepID=UPI002EE9712F